MGTFESFRKAYGALKDSTKVGLAKVNSEYKDLDIAVVKATNHVECPPKERHVRKIFSATSVVQPRADVAYCIHALARRLSKTRNWVVALKTLIVIHRTLREGDPSFREELVNYSARAHILQISNFKDDSSPLAWDCSAWVRTYALFLEERLECFRTLKYDIESERLTKISPGATKAHSRTRLLSREELLEQLPALQQLLYRLIGCQPEGAACYNYLIQYALALVLKESFKIYCGINDGIINLVDMFFEMPRHDAVKALNIYKRAGQQAENLANFYEFCKALDLSRNFQFPTLRQPPPSFLATMEEYIREAPQSGSVSNKKLEYLEKPETPQKPEEPDEPQESESPKPEEPANEEVQEDEPTENTPEEPQVKPETDPAPLISPDDVGDLLGLNETNPKALELEQANALALAIVQPGNDPLSANQGLSDFGVSSSGWELALVATPTNNNTNKLAERKLAGGFDKLLLDSLYEDDHARRQLQLQNAGYSYDMSMQYPSYTQPDPFAVSNNISPPSNVQFAMMQQQQQQLMFQNQHHQQQYQMTMYQNQQQFSQHNLMMVPHGQQQYLPQYPQQQMAHIDPSNPFSDPFSLATNTVKQPAGHHLL